MKYKTPTDYKSKLDLIQTEIAIKKIKDNFEANISKSLNLLRVSAPLFVRNDSGINDDLNGIERPVTFDIKNIDYDVSVVQSLAKWKRVALKRYMIPKGHGIYTDMNAIRRDEDLDNLHSVYVDQWDWEYVIDKDERKLSTLKKIVKKIYKSILKTQEKIIKDFPQLTPYFNKDLYFIDSSKLEEKYKGFDAKERENLICKEYGTVFIYKIGGKLKGGNPPHDLRAPDYDDWKLNGDILVYYPPLECAVEISSMGIRVDEKSLKKQLKITKCESRLNMPFHKLLINGELPYTIGGGIGQSRLCLVLLNKVHIGEVQTSIWDKETIEISKKRKITLL
ncbi:MAG: aspartate--ammonia ligase [Bacilli bacterium]|nr:aspartate--ammonia ligase [Bacilli bacterium]